MQSNQGSGEQRRWYQGAPPKSTGMFIGVICGLGFVLPFIGATYLDQALGDGWTIAILIALICFCVLAAVVLFIRGRIVEGILLAPVALGLGLAAWITATMEW